MFDRLEASFDQIRRVSQDASHELKTTLSLIRLHAEHLLSAKPADAPHAEALVTQIEEISRVNRIIDDLLFLSRAEANAVMREPTDVAAYMAGFEPDARVMAEHHGLTLAFHNEAPGVASVDGKSIRQVLLNIVSDAIHASPPHGRLVLASRVVDGMWTVSLDDEGPGVPDTELERIFERFVRLGQIAGGGRGSGLGLAISRGIMRLHGGAICARRTAGGGLQIRFEGPLIAPGPPWRSSDGGRSAALPAPPAEVAARR